MKARYVNLFTDFGFKKIFGEEASKRLLVDFLNSLLPNLHIVNLSFKDKEQLGRTIEERKAVYDIYCENEKGEKIIVELQKSKQKYFKDRTVYYATFPIQEQATKGDWRYELQAVYCIGILDFTFDDKNENSELPEVVHTVSLKNQNNELFFDKLTFVYLEMPNFNKNEHELTSRLDKWLYFIKHVESLDSIPEIFNDEVFAEAFTKAEIAKYSESERLEYESSLKVYRDLKGAFDSAFDEGRMLERKQLITQLRLNGFSDTEIVRLTRLSEDEINKL